MMNAIKIFFTVISSMLTGFENIALSFVDLTTVVRTNSQNFAAQEAIEADAKTKAIAKQIAALEHQA